MLSFTYPLALLGLPLAVLLAWWWLRRRQPAFRYVDLGLVAGLPTGRSTLVRWGGAILRGLVAAVLVLAIAGPRTPDLKTRLPVEGISIVLVLDTSNSMAEADFGPPGGPTITRLDAAKAAFRLFVAGGTTPDGTEIQGRPTDQIGLVTFAAVPQTACPPTLNHSVLLNVLNAQTVQSGVNAGTNIGDAIAEGIIRLDPTNTADHRKRVMILLSDGEHNALGGDAFTPLKSAQLAAHFGIPVYTIDCGGDPNPMMKPEEQKAREDGRLNLAAVAKLTQASSFTANNAAELQEVCKTIDRLERVPIESPRYRRYHLYDYWCGATAIGLLLLLALMEQTYWRRWPT